MCLYLEYMYLNDNVFYKENYLEHLLDTTQDGT